MKNGCKVFTKNNEKGIIRKKYNFFTANNKKYLQRKGLLMKETKEITLNGVTKELNWKEYTFEDLGFPVTQTKSIRRTSKTIELDITQ